MAEDVTDDEGEAGLTSDDDGGNSEICGGVGVVMDEIDEVKVEDGSLVGVGDIVVESSSVDDVDEVGSKESEDMGP